MRRILDRNLHPDFVSRVTDIWHCFIFVLYNICFFYLVCLPHSLQMFTLVRLEKDLSEIFEQLQSFRSEFLFEERQM